MERQPRTKLTKTFSNLNFYKLFWIFVVGSILGYLVETIYCFALRGFIESRRGLLYGPFSPIYGFSAVVAVLLLEPLAKKNDRWLFLGGALVGGAYEYLCSIFLEKVFGTVSWDYSKQMFSIGGRTSLTYMFFWGILCFVFIKGIYPKLSHAIERILNRQGIFLTRILIIILSLDILLSATTICRWTLRQKGVPPANAYEVFLDTTYPNETLEEIYPNMRIRK